MNHPYKKPRADRYVPDADSLLAEELEQQMAELHMHGFSVSYQDAFHVEDLIARENKEFWNSIPDGNRFAAQTCSFMFSVTSMMRLFLSRTLLYHS